MSSEKNNSAQNEENTNSTFDELFDTHPTQDNQSDDMPVVSIEAAIPNVDVSLHDEAPEDYLDHQESFQKPEEIKTEQEKEDEAMEEPTEIIVFEVIAKNAFVAYETGVMALYTAIAWIYIWMHFVNQDEEYKAKVFSDESDQENSHDYIKAVKVCLKIDAKQKSTITLYKDCLVYLSQNLPDSIRCNITNDESCTKKIAKFIKNNGGIKKCANKGKGEGDTSNSNKEAITKSDYKRAKEDYLSSHDVVGSMSNSDFGKYSDDDLVIMIARKVKGKVDELEIVDSLDEQDVLNAFIKSKIHKVKAEEKRKEEAGILQQKTSPLGNN